MSDFLSRVAARAVGAPPVARPRLPAFFSEHAADEIEVVQERVPAPASRTPVREERPVRETLTTRPDQVPAESPRPGFVEQHTEVVEPTPHEQLLVVERSTTHERESAPAVHVTQLEERRPELVQQASPAVAAQATPVVLEAERASAAPAPTSAEEAPSVRVHIGRLEVRANLQQAPPQRPRRAEPRAQELSLSDYLRGKREAG